MLGIVLVSFTFPDRIVHAQPFRFIATKPEAKSNKPITVYRNVQLIDSQKSKIQPNMAVIEIGNRIYSVLPQNPLSRHKLKNATIVEGNAAYIIPVLIDTHVHLDSVQTR